MAGLKIQGQVYQPQPSHSYSELPRITPSSREKTVVRVEMAAKFMVAPGLNYEL
jgi:hypothetical protein